MKSLIYSIIAAFGVPHLIHRLLNKGEISILMYHGVVKTEQALPDWCCLHVDSFRAQMKYLKKHFNLVSLSQAVEMLECNQVDGPTAVITFDDGYQNNYDQAYPLLVEEGIPATIFLTTGLIGSESTIWTGLLHNAFNKTRQMRLIWSNDTYDLSTVDKKQRALGTIKKALKKIHHKVAMVEVDKIVLELLGEEGFFVSEESPYRMLDSKSITKMAQSGLIEFGGHTVNHPILGHMLKDEQEYEISTSIEKVNEILSGSCTSFAYPDGSYNGETVSILREAGIKIALTTVEGTGSKTSSSLELRRFSVGAGLPMANFKLLVHNMVTHNN